MARDDPVEVETEVVRCFERLLGLSERRPATNDPYTTHSLVGYDISCDSHDDLADARHILDAAMRPAKRDETIKLLVRLRVLTVSRSTSEEDLSLTLAAYADELADLPADALRCAAGMWARQYKFWPTLAELRGSAEKLCAKRLLLVDALDRAGPRPEWLPGFAIQRGGQ